MKKHYQKPEILMEIADMEEAMLAASLTLSETNADVTLEALSRDDDFFN